MKILIGIILGYIIHHHIRRLFLKWQLRELKRMAGIQSSEEGFYGTPGKCLQSAIDAETEVFGDSLILFHESPLLSQLKYYFYRLAHPDPVIYGDDIAEGHIPSGNVKSDDSSDITISICPCYFTPKRSLK